jgi:broad specificity phosphatase PhoE
MAEIIALRHGQTEWSLTGRHTGRTDVPLTAVGQERARTAGTLLAGRTIVEVWSSPAQRATRTAELAGLKVTRMEPDLWEWDYGGYEGLTTEQIQEEHPGWYLWRDGVAPGGPDAPYGHTEGESVEDVGARCDRVIESLRALVSPASALEVDGDIVLVAHGHVLRVLAARWLGLEPAAGALFALDTASISRLGFEHGRPCLTLWNRTAD